MKIRLAVILFAILFTAMSSCASSETPPAKSENSSRSGDRIESEQPLESFEWMGAYEEAGDITEGLYPVKDSGYWGFTDKEGNVVIECLYDAYRPFEYGLAPVSRNGNWGVVDKTGKVVINTEYSGVGKITEKLIETYNRKENTLANRFVFLTNGTNIISEKQFTILEIYDDEECFAVSEFMSKDGNWGDYICLYNFLGQCLFNGWDEKVIAFKDFSDGWALIKTDKKGIWQMDKANYINTDGKLFSDMWYDNALPWNGDRAAVACIVDEDFSITKSKEEMLHWYIVDKGNKKVSDLPGGIAYTDFWGELLIGCELVEGKYTQKVNGDYCVVSSKTGEVMHKGLLSYSIIQETKYSIIQDSKTSLYGIINEKGVLVEEMDYNIIEYSEGIFTYTKGSQSGYFDI